MTLFLKYDPQGLTQNPSFLDLTTQRETEKTKTVLTREES